MSIGMAELDQAVSSGRIADIAGILDRHELELQQAEFPPAWPLAVHMLAHMYNYNLEDARFLWKRTLPEMKQGAEVQKTFELLQRLWNKDYQGVWGVLGGFEWSPPVQPLVHALCAALRSRMLAVVQRAYATLTAAQLASYMGVPELDALRAAASAGWEYDASTGLLRVVEPKVQPASRAQVEHLQRLTEYVTHLES